MIARLRWNSGTVSRGQISLIANGIRSEEFSDDAWVGFLFTEHGKTFVGGRFVRRTEVRREVVTPFGDVIFYPAVGFDVTTFRVSSTFPQLEIRDPARSFRTIYARFGEFTDFKVSFLEIQTDVLAWVSAFCKEVSDSIVESIRVRNVSVAASTWIDAEVTGLSARSIYEKQFGKFAHQLFSAKLSCGLGTVELTCGGTATVVSRPNDIEKLIGATRKSLRYAVVDS